jgi:hypothetical protein
MIVSSNVAFHPELDARKYTTGLPENLIAA